MKRKPTTASEPEGARQRLTHSVMLRQTAQDVGGFGAGGLRRDHWQNPIAEPFPAIAHHRPGFAWLRPLSQLIVAMDEALDAEEPLTLTKVEALVRQANVMLVVSETSEGFSGHYHEALQRDPDVVLAHAEVVKLRGPRKT